MKAINSFIGLTERWGFQGIQTEVSLVSVNDLNVWDGQHREGWATVTLQSEQIRPKRVGEKRGAEGWDGGYQGDDGEGLWSVDGSGTL